MPKFTVKLKEINILYATIDAVDFTDAARRAEDGDFDEEPSESEIEGSTSLLEIRIQRGQS